MKSILYMLFLSFMSDQIRSYQPDSTYDLLRLTLEILSYLFILFYVVRLLYGAILNYVICACASHWFNQGPPDTTVAERKEIFEFGEEMKFVVVFEVGFIAELSILSYLSRCYYIVRAKNVGTGKVARVVFLGGIPPKFEHQLRRHE